MRDDSVQALSAADRAFADRLAAEVARANPAAAAEADGTPPKSRGGPLLTGSLPEAIAREDTESPSGGGTLVEGEVREKVQAFLKSAHDSLLQFDPPLSEDRRRAELLALT